MNRAIIKQSKTNSEQIFMREREREKERDCSDLIQTETERQTD